MTILASPWFGRVRTCWPVVPLRSVASLGTGHTPSRAVPEYWENCTVPWVTVEDIRRLGEWSLSPLYDTEQKISELGLANSAAVLHPRGTVMLSRTASIGFSCIIGCEMATTQAFVTWTPDSSRLLGVYLLAVLKAMGQQYEYLAYGATHLTIYFPDVKTLRVPLPPLDVQAEVVAFLDRETAKIDALIAEQERLIALLQEKRQAVISHAVTKGLDPSVPMKDSGVEWIGEVPAHWTVCALRRTVRTSINGVWGEDPDASGDGTPCVRAADFDRHNWRATVERAPLRLIAERELTARSLQPGDLIIEKSGGGEQQPVGCVVMYDADHEAVCSNFCARLQASADCDPAFLVLLHAFLYGRRITTRSIKQSTGIQNLDMGSYLTERIALPPLVEQVAIRKDVTSTLRSCDAGMSAASDAITLLRERRSALITAAVTGQIDVRGLVEPAA